MGAITLHISASAAARLDNAHGVLDTLSVASEALLVGATREAVDDFARVRANRRGASFGLHRFSLRQLASRVASTRLAREHLAPATSLGAEAVAARAAFEEVGEETLRYFTRIARLRSFGRTLASTLNELRFGDMAGERLSRCGPAGADVQLLARRYADQLAQAQLVDIPRLYQLATTVIRESDTIGIPLEAPMVLVDVPVHDQVTLELVAVLATRAERLDVTVADGDTRTRVALERLPEVTSLVVADPADATAPLSRVRARLFQSMELPSTETAVTADEEVTLFSAPGETRECVEIARAVQRQARAGVPLDQMAVLLRAPQVYAGLLETALRRAGVETWFVRGTRAPDPAGRAFLALLGCRAEQLSARRFSEYLSLGQVPRPDAKGAPPTNRARWVPPSGTDVLAEEARPVQPSLFALVDLEAETDGGLGSETDPPPVVEGALRAPWRWDRLLVESAVIGGRDRWARRLTGLEHELRVRLEECLSEDPESPRVRRLAGDLDDLGHLSRFALPVIERLSEFPERALWGEWLDRLEALAPMVLRWPDRVLATLTELRPMADVGPTPLAEVQDVLAERLTELQADPPARRYGRVFVGAPEHVRGRVFHVVFVPGLAERVFPQKQRQDPLLLDDLRRVLNTGTGEKWTEDNPVLGLPVLDDRAASERLLLRLAVGAATRRLYLSYPRLQLGESRPRVPSFYALDLERARTGRVPDFAVTEREAFRRVDSRLAWPAPPDPDDAIDDTEHDLAVLGPLLRQHVSPELTGRARYLLQLEPGLRRSLLTRWARWKPPWSRYDGLYHPDTAAHEALDTYRLSARPYSVSALQRFAMCPYQFLLAAVFRLQPREEIASLERLDPLTRGRMFHEVQAELVRALEMRGALPVTRERLQETWTLLDETLDRVAARYYEELAPAIDRVWTDEVEKLRNDLKGWVHQVSDEDGEWIPIRAELGFGFPAAPGRDARSVPEPVSLEGGWKLHGIVDLVEARARPTVDGELRVTDHKTGRNRTAERMVVGHGEVLQPVLYGMAVEQALGRPVSESRLFFSTVAGGYTTRTVPLGETERRHGLEVLTIIDRALEMGVIVPAPRRGACAWCDFRPVCGPWEETRVLRKDETKLVDLSVLRRLP